MDLQLHSFVLCTPDARARQIYNIRVERALFATAAENWTNSTPKIAYAFSISFIRYGSILLRASLPQAKDDWQRSVQTQWKTYHYFLLFFTMMAPWCFSLWLAVTGVAGVVAAVAVHDPLGSQQTQITSITIRKKRKHTQSIAGGNKHQTCITNFDEVFVVFFSICVVCTAHAHAHFVSSPAADISGYFRQPQPALLLCVSFFCYYIRCLLCMDVFILFVFFMSLS